MSKGFSANQKSDVDWVISSIQKNKKALRGNLNFKRDLNTNFWYDSYSKIEYPAPPLATLFSPFNQHSCVIAESPRKDSVVGKHNQQYVFFANTDFWYVLVRRENLSLHGMAHRQVSGIPQTKHKKDHYEFQIGVKVGPYPFFMPSLIKERICGWHGQEVYNSWRKMVKEDMKNLAPYISAFNPPKHLYSFTCDDSSARVCESLGLPVKHGVAYWLRQADVDFNPEVVAEVVKGTAVSGLNLQECFGKQSTSALKIIGNYVKHGPGGFINSAMNAMAS